MLSAFWGFFYLDSSSISTIPILLTTRTVWSSVSDRNCGVFRHVVLCRFYCLVRVGSYRVSAAGIGKDLSFMPATSSKCHSMDRICPVDLVGARHDWPIVRNDGCPLVGHDF
eukprot:scaffold1064_cov85-Amphora_coffeaeformis.AAC.17